MKNFGFIKVASAIPSVKVGDVTFEQGEAMLVVNNWKNNGVASIVYFDLPDPLTPMPEPEK